MKKHWLYLKYVVRHKYFVFREGLRLDVPIIQLIAHDWTKFLPREWFPYADTFYGGPYRTHEEIFSEPTLVVSGVFIRPDYNEKSKEAVKDAFDRAWLAHQHASPHHHQHWVLRQDSGAVKVLEMPEHFAREMVADWIGAGLAMGKGRGDAKEWYIRNQDCMLLHSATRAYVEALLGLTTLT